MANPFLLFMMGFSFLMALFMLFKSALNDWERANLYCALVFAACFFNCLCLLVDFDLAYYGFYSINSLESTPATWFNHLTPTFLLFLYRDFLEMKTNSLRFYRFMTFALRLIMVTIFAEIVLTFIPKFAVVFDWMTHIFQVVLLIVFLVLPFYTLRFWRHPIYRFAAWSSWNITFIYGSFLLLSATGLEIYLPHWIIENMLYIIILIDGIFFLFALTVRDRQLIIEKTQLQQQAAISELKALRSQMNPHFIFNCLNAIKSYTLNHDTEGADFYLTKFSKLIRQVLENSRSEKITLQSELETLTLYLDMEKLRAGDKLNYELKIADDLETDFIEIPPMLIQPYIENAIWHGLMHKEEGGKIVVDCRQKDDKWLIISILDNGIGRERAAELKSKTATKHKSFGMKIASERMDITKQLYNIETKITINDLKNTEGDPTGTQVILEIPL
jgi:sensor histidine kinase YesM